MKEMTIEPVWTLFIASAVATIFAIVALFILLLLKQSQNNLKYNFELQRALLTADRESYERRIAQATLQMTSSEDRFRDANHLILSDKFKNTGDLQPDLDAFLRGMGIQKREIKIDTRLVMILTPFSQDELPTYSAMKDACSRIGLTPVRGDEQFIKGDILAHVVRLIASARLVVANISSRNANVFYELGIAHAMNKPTLLVSHTLNETPFDLNNNRIIVYRDAAELKNVLTEGLARLLAESSPMPDVGAP